jgi:hypothetical protein
MTETAILAIVTLLTLIVTNLFAVWKAAAAERAVERAAAAGAVAADLTHRAVAAVQTKLDDVHREVTAQPNRMDLTAAIAAVQFQLADQGGTVPVAPSASIVEAPASIVEAPAPPGFIPDTRASG